MRNIHGHLHGLETLHYKYCKPFHILKLNVKFFILNKKTLFSELWRETAIVSNNVKFGF